MKPFLHADFLLDNEPAVQLYHEYARDMPIVDYHSHLSPAAIAQDFRFPNLTAAWLSGDHYKWRAMRTNGVPETYCAGDAPDPEKFRQWAATVPYTIRNPLYHWTHLELQRYFNVQTLLDPNSADAIYEQCSALLQRPDYSVQGLLRRMNVEVVCTTDDPADPLDHHLTLRDRPAGIRMVPAFRPDRLLQTDDLPAFNAYLDKLEAASGVSISGLESLETAIRRRHDFFAAAGCTVSDHGLEYVYNEPFTRESAGMAFAQLRSGKTGSSEAVLRYKSYLLHFLAVLDHEKGWVQQFHLGAMRNNNARMMKKLGADTGWDSIGDWPQASSLAGFLGRLDAQEQLTRTILYNLNPAWNEVMATMAGNFNDGSVAGKVQFGAAWWFLDQKEGMIRQLNSLSAMGLLSRFVGMLTDSRSFLSFPRHEYFRRILCNLLGTEITRGELPNDLPWIGKLVQDICYHNAKRYFNWS